MNDLLQKVDENKNCLNEAQTVIQSRSSKYVFIFNGPFVNDEKIAITEVDKGNLKQVEIKNINVIKKFLDYFGSFVETIGVYFENIDSKEGKEIVEKLNEKCSQSLNKLYLKDYREDFLDALKNEFSKLGAFKFSSSSSHDLKFNSENTNVAKLFPAIKYLSIDYMKAADWKFIGDKVPSLSGFRITLPNSRKEGDVDELQIINFLKQNPKITNLKITEGELSKEQFANIPEALPKLEIVGLSCASKFVADEVISFIEKSKSLFEFNVTLEMDESEQKWFVDILPTKFPKMLIHPKLTKNGEKVTIYVKM